MLIQLSPPPQQDVRSAVELPVLSGSDPLLLATYRWTVAHSPSLQQVVRQLVGAERKARYRFTPGLEANYGRLVVLATEEGYEIEIQVPILAWTRCDDALEPWIATALFLALESAGKGKYRETRDAQLLLFLRETRQAAFAFQARVRKELTAADPQRLKDLPDGALLYQGGFPPSPASAQGPRGRRTLPEGLE